MISIFQLTNIFFIVVLVNTSCYSVFCKYVPLTFDRLVSISPRLRLVYGSTIVVEVQCFHPLASTHLLDSYTVVLWRGNVHCLDPVSKGSIFTRVKKGILIRFNSILVLSVLSFKVYKSTSMI